MTNRTILDAESVWFEGPAGAQVQMLHPGIHLGLMLFEEIAERGLSPSSLAKLLGVTTARISSVERGRSPVTAELALLLGKAFGQSPRFWLAQQAPDGHLKLPHLWPGQTPAPEQVADAAKLRG
jgi:addiction module HigA family antidote